jgi:hypothetical protein
VYLDGVEVKHVFSADSDKGEVIAAVLDSREASLPSGEVNARAVRSGGIERSPK